MRVDAGAVRIRCVGIGLLMSILFVYRNTRAPRGASRRNGLCASQARIYGLGSIMCAGWLGVGESDRVWSARETSRAGGTKVQLTDPA